MIKRNIISFFSCQLREFLTPLEIWNIVQSFSTNIIYRNPSPHSPQLPSLVTYRWLCYNCHALIATSKISNGNLLVFISGIMSYFHSKALLALDPLTDVNPYFSLTDFPTNSLVHSHLSNAECKNDE